MKIPVCSAGSRLLAGDSTPARPERRRALLALLAGTAGTCIATQAGRSASPQVAGAPVPAAAPRSGPDGERALAYYRSARF